MPDQGKFRSAATINIGSDPGVTQRVRYAELDDFDRNQPRTAVLSLAPTAALIQHGNMKRGCARANPRLCYTPRLGLAAMSRPRAFEEKRIATAVRLPESVHRRLHQAATERDVSANLLVTRAVSDYLDRLPTTTEILTVRRRAGRKASQ